MLDTFVKKFTDKEIKFVKIGKKYFLENKKLEENRLNVKEKFFGLLLGQDREGKFTPSFGLLDLLSKMSNEKIFVKDIGEMDFLYGKHLRVRHVLRIEGEKKIGFLKLVQNEHDENIGYGKYVGEEGKIQVLKHRMDRGIFLKRDKEKVMH
ncbi:hypothetical protein HN681_01720 [archaeon]|jgi:ribosome biogenesis protein Nip4|nr:hypothetical protein [archaeon]MBT3731082.1 hypothetical protein [archaeon]MBT4670195.1 hypothetical protein [archaeon]MBT5030515.1 hypothetical protein [archaeon]MBT5287868.1 hypothetical protein [archaeon]